MLKAYSYQNTHAHTFEYLPGTNAEAFVVGEVVTLSSGALTKAAVDTEGVQEYVMLQAATGDGTTELACIRIDGNINFIVEDANVASGTYVVGNAYTLNSDADGITNTTTKGVFVVKQNMTNGDVVGYFRTVYNR